MWYSPKMMALLGHHWVIVHYLEELEFLCLKTRAWVQGIKEKQEISADFPY